MVALAAGTAYLVYLQQFEKKPLGKNNPYFDQDQIPESERDKSRGQRRREEEDKEANPRRGRELEERLRRDANKAPVNDSRKKNPKNPRGIASPNDVSIRKLEIYFS